MQIMETNNEEANTEFIRCYNDNIAKVFSAIEQHSNKHKINDEAATAFIDGQMQNTTWRTLILCIFIAVNQTNRIIF